MTVAAGMEVRDAKRGQASVEFLIIFSISIVILVFISMLVYQQMVDVGVEKENAESEKTVSDISSAVREVYSQGDGASKTLLVILPSTYDPANSGIFNNTLVLRTRGTSHVAYFPFAVTGALPQTPGAHEILILASGSGVYIGGSIFRLSQNLISLVLPGLTSQTKTVTISNLINETIYVNGIPQWSHPEVALSQPDLAFSLDPYESRDLSFTFSASNVSGSYSGGVAFSANSTLMNDSQTLGLYVDVPAIIINVNGTKKMNVLPSEWNLTISRNSSANGTFTICAINTPINVVSQKPSHGLAGAWVDRYYGPISIAQDSCSQSMLSITVPARIPPGTYTGQITFTGDNTYVVVVPLNVVVQ